MTRGILLVDDDPDDAELFRLAARDAGLSYPITIARGGEEALDLLLRRGFSPVVTLLDLKMPGLDGLEVLRRLREHPTLCDAEVIVLSSSDLASDQSEAARLGCKAYLVKPSSFAEYVAMASRIKGLLA